MPADGALDSGPGVPYDGPRIARIVFEADVMVAEMTDGARHRMPLAFYPRLLYATAGERAGYELSGGGWAAHWPDVDEDIAAEHFVKGKGSLEGRASFLRWLEARRPLAEAA